MPAAHAAGPRVIGTVGAAQLTTGAKTAWGSLEVATPLQARRLR